jgi:two-component system, NarL family, sensor histidine kinase NreB
VETALYRITQEASMAAPVVCSSTSTRTTTTFDAVRDDSVGFDPHTKADGLGLDIIRERAELPGGMLEINSAPGRGTQITAVLLTDRATSQRASSGKCNHVSHAP